MYHQAKFHPDRWHRRRDSVTGQIERYKELQQTWYHTNRILALRLSIITMSWRKLGKKIIFFAPRYPTKVMIFWSQHTSSPSSNGHYYWRGTRFTQKTETSAFLATSVDSGHICRRRLLVRMPETEAHGAGSFIRAFFTI